MRYITMITMTLLGLLSVCGPTSASEPSGGKVLLSIEPVLIDAEGMHPQAEATADLIPVSSGVGSYHHLLQLGPSKDDILYIVLSYRITPGGLIELSLTRSIRSAGKEEKLPSIAKEISPLDSWRTTLIEDTGNGGHLELRVVPVLRKEVADEPLDSSTLQMHLTGGPLVQYAETPDADRVLFREVNMTGTGLSFGIPGVGTIRLSTSKLKGSHACGWVRGHRLSFSMAGRDYSIWSTRMILPEDQDRPGKGWTLFGELRPWSSSAEELASYGGFVAGP